MKRPPLIALAGAGIVLALVAAGIWFRADSASSTGPGRGGRGQPIAVETAPVERVTLRDLRGFSGTLRAEAQFDVAPKIAGRMERLLVDLGDTVRNGQVVARLDDDEAEQQVQQARAELGVAQAGLAEARSLLSVKQAQLGRIRQLHERRIAAQTELETAEVEAVAQQARVQVTQAQVTQREAALRAAEVRKSYTVIRAAWHGGSEVRHVGERYASEGALLAANQPILSIVETRLLTAVVSAPELDYPWLRVGQPATVRVEALPQRRFPGRIVRLAPVFRETSRQARIEVQVDNAEGLLKPGMFAAVEVEVGEVHNAATVPEAAVVTRDGRRGVFRVDAQQRRVEFVPVRTGIVEGGRVQIVEPDLEGRVATLGNHLLSDGAPVVLPEAQERGGAGPAGGNPGPQGKPGPAGGGREGR
jgi:RND family efflux transporter MFP subunit